LMKLIAHTPCHSLLLPISHYFFFFNPPATTEIYTLSLHDAVPISGPEGDRVLAMVQLWRTKCPTGGRSPDLPAPLRTRYRGDRRSEEHTSELQSPYDLVCRLLLEKKKKN